MLVSDYVENWWRRQRIRRSEAIELRNRLAALNLGRKFEDEDRVEELARCGIITLTKQSAGVGWQASTMEDGAASFSSTYRLKGRLLNSNFTNQSPR
jgi:hypothetical protein